MIPACVVSKIQSCFPDPDNEYEGFHDMFAFGEY